MNQISDAQITVYVEANIGTFHDKRLESLNKLKLRDLLRRKNPYLFKSKNLTVATDLVRSILDAHLSSQEETLFGEFLEGLAVYVAEAVHGGWKSSATGIDLEFAIGETRYIVSIKSGPNWGNSLQIARLKENFTTAARVIRQGNRTANIIAVTGCCYGRDNNPDKGGYFKYCGQEFWELISRDSELYTRIIEPLGHNAKQRNQAFAEQYGALVNRLSQEFTGAFCLSDGSIDWPKLVAVSSERRVSRSEFVASVIRAAYEIIEESSDPVSKSELMRLLTERGFEFAGKNPEEAVTRIVRRDARVRLQRRKPSGWVRAEATNC